jgi:hypothetical protein
VGFISEPDGREPSDSEEMLSLPYNLIPYFEQSRETFCSSESNVFLADPSLSFSLSRSFSFSFSEEPPLSRSREEEAESK